MDQSADDNGEYLCNVKNFKKVRAFLNEDAKASEFNESYEKFWSLVDQCLNKTEYLEFGWGLNDMTFYANKAGYTKVCRNKLSIFIRDKRFESLPEALKKASKTNYKNCNSTEILKRIDENKDYLKKGFGGLCKRDNIELFNSLNCEKPFADIEKAAHFSRLQQWPELLPFDTKLCKTVAERIEECKKAKVVPVATSDFTKLIPGYSTEKLKTAKREYGEPNYEVLRKMLYSSVPDTDAIHDKFYHYSNDQKSLINEIENIFFSNSASSEVVSFREGKFLYVLASPPPWRESTCYVEDTASCHALFWVDLEEFKSLLIVDTQVPGGGGVVGYASEYLNDFPESMKRQLLKNFPRLNEVADRNKKIMIVKGQNIETIDFMMDKNEKN